MSRRIDYQLVMRGGVWALAFLFLAGCAKDLDTPVAQSSELLQVESESVERARVFVESQAAGSQTRGVNAKHLSLGDLELDWAEARTWKDKEQKLTVTEIPTTLVGSYLYAVLVEQFGQTISQTIQEPHTRVLVYDYHGRDKRMEILLATLLPDEGWGGELSELYARPVESDFCGVTVYSAVDGAALWGERWSSGFATHDLFFDDGNYGVVAEDMKIGIGVRGGVETRGFDENDPTEIDDVKVIGKKEEDVSVPVDDPKFPDKIKIDDRIVTGGDGGGNPGNGNGDNTNGRKNTYDPTVKVPDGQCVIGSIAAALQAKFGLPPAEAIAQAIAALEAAGVATTVVDGGITIYDTQTAAVLTSLGFTVVPLEGEVKSSVVASHFNNDGFGIGHFVNDLGHYIFLIGFDSRNNTFTYYDSVTGRDHVGNPDEAILYFK